MDSVHTRINPYGMSMDGKPEQVVPILRKLRAAGKGVVGMKIVGNGNLRDDPDRREQSVRFALHLDCVDVLNVGCESTDEVDDIAACVRKVPAKSSRPGSATVPVAVIGVSPMTLCAYDKNQSVSRIHRRECPPFIGDSGHKLR